MKRNYDETLRNRYKYHRVNFNVQSVKLNALMNLNARIAALRNHQTVTRYKVNDHIAKIATFS